jgi:hypothetical protein
MPANSFTSKAKTDEPYRVDNRATLNVPLRPTSHDLADGPTLTAVSGVRTFYPSGTDN